MASLNKVLLIGNLTRDPEVRYTPSGKPVMHLRLAVNRRYRDRDNNWRDDTLFIDAEVWGQQAERLAEQLKKGSAVFVDGRLKMDEWTSKDGTKRSKITVSGFSVTPILRAESSRGGDTQSSSPPSSDSEPPGDKDNLAPDDDEPPF